jgi:exopolysaccharide biosynthesis protein
MQPTSSIAGIDDLNADIRYWTDSQQGLRIIYVRNRSLRYLYRPENKLTVRKLAEAENMVVAVNGAYFSGNYTNAQHAGLLYMNGKTIVKQSLSDPQISHVVSILQDGTIEFTANKDFALTNKVATAFQSGPLVLADNNIATTFIAESTNGNGKYKRTLLGKTADGDLFFVITNQPYTLTEVATMLLQNPLLADKLISVINLDGGASTAMYSRDNVDFNFNTSWFLPILIGV